MDKAWNEINNIMIENFLSIHSDIGLRNLHTQSYLFYSLISNLATVTLRSIEIRGRHIFT